MISPSPSAFTCDAEAKDHPEPDRTRICTPHAVAATPLWSLNMRDPSLVEPRSVTTLRVKPPHGRQTRVALGLETNGEDDSHANAYNHPLTSGENGDFRLIYRRDVYGDRQENNHSVTGQNGATPSGVPETARPSQTSMSGRRQALQRARSDFGPRHRGERNAAVIEEDLWRMRHGWEDEYTSNEYLALLNSVSSSTNHDDGL